MELQNEIKKFITDNRVATVCFLNKDNTPHCISALYAFDKENIIIWIKSSAKTEHDELINTGDKVSGTILPEQFNIMHIQGVQFKGELIKASVTDFKVSQLYYLKYPVGLAMPGYIWGVKIKEIKFSDTVNGFPNKLKWMAEH